MALVANVALDSSPVGKWRLLAHVDEQYSLFLSVIPKI